MMFLVSLRRVSTEIGKADRGRLPKPICKAYHPRTVSTKLTFDIKMFDDDDAILASAAFIIIAAQKKRRRRPRFWVRPSLQSRKKYSPSDLIKDLILDDTNVLNLEYRSNGGFKNCFRMSSSAFEQLLQKIGPMISKQDTNYRKAISAQDRLAITLRFLATGDSYYSLMYLFKTSTAVISRTIPEVCTALIEVLQGYVKVSFLFH